MQVAMGHGRMPKYPQEKSDQISEISLTPGKRTVTKKLKDSIYWYDAEKRSPVCVVAGHVC